MGKKVFISYSSEDHHKAETLASRFESFGYDVWWDRFCVGPGLLVDKIVNAIECTSIFAVLISESSIISKWVKFEIENACRFFLNGKKMIILPILLENIRTHSSLLCFHHVTFPSNELEFHEFFNQLNNIQNQEDPVSPKSTDYDEGGRYRRDTTDTIWNDPIRNDDSIRTEYLIRLTETIYNLSEISSGTGITEVAAQCLLHHLGSICVPMLRSPSFSVADVVSYVRRHFIQAELPTVLCFGEQSKASDDVICINTAIYELGNPMVWLDYPPFDLLNKAISTIKHKSPKTSIIRYHLIDKINRNMIYIHQLARVAYSHLSLGIGFGILPVKCREKTAPFHNVMTLSTNAQFRCGDNMFDWRVESENRGDANVIDLKDNLMLLAKHEGVLLLVDEFLALDEKKRVIMIIKIIETYFNGETSKLKWPA